eukprot:gb/GFBE01055312.1/.p1 GENE.gb/GFBE01055312.1/~~gb/GFBE01055312.1/.p1  ORF type:complete len:142 (+),score=16.88 gb/GFBE01055312.1/:1-426(+)
MSTGAGFVVVHPLGCNSGPDKNVVLEGLTPESTVLDLILAYREETGICGCLYSLNMIPEIASGGPPKEDEYGESCTPQEAPQPDLGRARTLAEVGIRVAPTPPDLETLKVGRGSLIISGRLRGDAQCDLCGKGMEQSGATE